MRTRRPTRWEDQPVPVRVRLAATWTSLVLLYAYVDILNFFTPGVVEEILDGRVFEFALSETFSTGALALMSVPILMVVLSASLPAPVNRVVNLVVALLYVPVTVFNVVGESWLYFYGLGVAVELVLLALVVRWAWTWPRSVPTAAVPDRAAVRTPQQA
ncbi:hypothetical protein ATJ88_2145 [Isoptericola jiangsuensis]|uniref:DoxX-like protein n=1 Tax=Isoptericola jiangsuensis TaxID=548579 RepID=A0A2A9EX43_9MICO|nr:DUF6326 family protein [Isoptericola jiangsuensis]PFG43448.1 hypothetical protein ATJ88_2145 [Isoptericola jiangsuensis]